MRTSEREELEQQLLKRQAEFYSILSGTIVICWIAAIIVSLVSIGAKLVG